MHLPIFDMLKWPQQPEFVKGQYSTQVLDSVVYQPPEEVPEEIWFAAAISTYQKLAGASGVKSGASSAEDQSAQGQTKRTDARWQFSMHPSSTGGLT